MMLMPMLAMLMMAVRMMARLQTMLGVSLSNWKELAPVDDRCLTQLGGCVVVAPDAEKFAWRDGGICNTADFEEVLAAL